MVPNFIVCVIKALKLVKYLPRKITTLYKKYFFSEVFTVPMSPIHLPHVNNHATFSYTAYGNIN